MYHCNASSEQAQVGKANLTPTAQRNEQQRRDSSAGTFQSNSPDWSRQVQPFRLPKAPWPETEQSKQGATLN